jgi:hypothetical protein
MHFEIYNDTKHKDLLEVYFKDNRTPYNNSNHKVFKTHLYNSKDGILGLLIDKTEIVGVTSAIKIIEKGIVSCKYPHRLHVRNDYSKYTSKFIDELWDPCLHNWLKLQNISNLYCTFNEDNENAFLWAALRHSRRIKKSNNEISLQILKGNWFIYPKLVLEMHTWQYIIYHSNLENWFYPWRQEEKIKGIMQNKLNKFFLYYDNLGWLI